MKATIVKRSNSSVQKGYSMIEVMLTLVVVGVGLLAIVQLQSSISGQVGDNKAKAEATSIAEARIEEIRNYTNEPKARDVEKFKTEYLIATTDYTNATEVAGINATFTREERVSDKGNVRQISVRVSWKERTDTTRDVTVTSEIAYVPPLSSGQNSINYASSIDFTPPSGIAKPGEGDKQDLNLPEGAFITNSDGTTEATDGTNKYLLDGNDIVLTLENADCTDADVNKCKDDFTRIHGRVYIDESTYSGLPVGEVYVIASNTAYCTRFLNDTTDGTTKYTYDSVDNVYTQDSTNPFIRIQNDTLSGVMTQTEGSYEYFDYTCYVGRGWYGSIGVYIAGGNQQNDRICMGDPDLPSSLTPDVALSPYRLYRGMVHALDPDGNEVYWSIGVQGSRDLGLESIDTTGRFQPTKPMHNFVLSTLDASPKFDAQDCIDRGVLTRDDAYSGLFTGVPDDFVCLNPDVDNFDANVYSIYPDCREDPRDLINNL